MGVYPEALGGALRRTAALVGDVPIIVTENGIATTDDRERVEYTSRALQSMRDAMGDGVTVGGYLHWSLLDNYEWGSYTPHSDSSRWTAPPSPAHHAHRWRGWATEPQPSHPNPEVSIPCNASH